MSAAAEPDTSVKNLKPGIGLKFLRNGVDSASLVAMYSVDGQDSWNFFLNDFTNHIPQASPALMPLAAKFATATESVQAVGLSDWGMIDQNGNKVTDPVFPFSLRFHPTGKIEFSDDYTEYYLD